MLPRFDGEHFTKVHSNSAYTHSNTYSLASYVGQPLITGGDDRHVKTGIHGLLRSKVRAILFKSHCVLIHPSLAKTELMDLKSNEWYEADDYPFHSRIRRYATTETKSSSYIIGGFAELNQVSTIAQFNKMKWTKLGFI